MGRQPGEAGLGMMNESEGSMMTSFERACQDTETAAASTLKAATDLAKLARTLQKAAREGNVSAIKRNAERLDGALDALRQEVANAVAAWPFEEGGEADYLRERYAVELRSVAAEKGLAIHERDGRLIAYPSIVRIFPGDHAIGIDKKKVSTLRPSYLAEILVHNQKKRPRFRSDMFLEALYKVYRQFAEPAGLLKEPVMPLARIYEIFTSLPGSGREYDKTEFARSLYFLESDGPGHTRSGARVSFPSSTGTRSARGTFPFVGPDGQVITYYGIRFSGGE